MGHTSRPIFILQCPRTPSKYWKPEACGHCGILNPPKRCGSCQNVAYCNKTCQQDDWSAHKSQCQGTVEDIPKFFQECIRTESLVRRRSRWEERNCSYSSQLCLPTCIIYGLTGPSVSLTVPDCNTRVTTGQIHTMYDLGKYTGWYRITGTDEQIYRMLLPFLIDPVAKMVAEYLGDDLPGAREDVCVTCGDNSARRLNCGHYWCQDCCQPWGKSVLVCPRCGKSTSLKTNYS